MGCLGEMRSSQSPGEWEGLNGKKGIWSDYQASGRHSWGSRSGI